MICDELKSRRKAMGFTLETLSIIAECSMGFISTMENGQRYVHPNSKKFKRLCLSLGYMPTRSEIDEANEYAHRYQTKTNRISGLRDPQPREAKDECLK